MPPEHPMPPEKPYLALAVEPGARLVQCVALRPSKL